MATITNRITSKDMRVEFIPYGTEQNHVVTLGYTGSGSGSGTFKLRVNGQLTGSITVASGAVAATALSTALTGLKNPDGTAMVASTDFEITGTNTPLSVEFKGKNANRYFVIRIEDMAITGGEVYLDTTQIGAGEIVLSADMSSFDYTISTSGVDVTAISEVEEAMLAVKSSMTFSLSMYNATQDYLYVLGDEILYGTLTVYPRGLGSGLPYFSFYAMKEEYGESYPDHEKVEISISGRRVGAMIVPFGAVQA